jgi:hypothetical protein
MAKKNYVFRYYTGIFFQTERMLDLSNKSLGLWAGLGTAALLGSYYQKTSIFVFLM